MAFVRTIESGGIIRAITPSDTALIHNCKAIWSNAGGAVSLKWDDEAAVGVTLPAGQAVPILGPVRVMATGTTAIVLGFFDR